MSHPVQLILLAAKEALDAELASDANVFLHRVRSLSEDELPAVTVNYGDDQPDEQAMTMDQFASAVEVVLSAHTTETTEEAALEKLLELRAAGHRAMQAVGDVAGVWNLTYQGAEAPAVEYGTDRAVGQLTSRWLVHYRMPISGPT